jgi:hypothetical protein
MDIFVGERRTSLFVKTLVVAALLTTTLLSALVGTSIAAKSSTSLTVPDGVYGGTTTATVTSGVSAASTTSGGSALWVRATCSQNGVSVYRQNVQLDSSGRAVLTLGPTPSWSGGAADCLADSAYYSNGRWRVVATDTFHVSG